MRISDWSSDVCSSDLFGAICALDCLHLKTQHPIAAIDIHEGSILDELWPQFLEKFGRRNLRSLGEDRSGQRLGAVFERAYIAAVSMFRSEEHTSELQSLMRISYACFCLKKKNTKKST